MTEFAQVSVTPDHLTIAPAEQAKASIFMQNTSNVVDVITLEVLGLDESWVALSVNSVSLFPGDSGTSELTISVPRSSGSPAGTYPFSIKAASRKDPSVNIELECTLEVQPYYEVSSEMHPQQVTGPSGDYKATLTNSGNTDLEIGLTGTDPQAALQFSYSKQTPRLAPGEPQQVTITASARSQPWRGMPKSYPFQVRASGPQNTVQPMELHGSLTVPPKLPRWAIPAAVACVVGLVAIIVLAIAFLGGDDESPTIAAPTTITATTPLAGEMDLSPDQTRSFEIIVDEPGLLILQVQWDVTGNGLQIKVAASESDQAFIRALEATGLPATLHDEELLVESSEFEIPIGEAYASHAMTVSFRNRTDSDTESTFSVGFRPATAISPEPVATATAIAQIPTPVPVIAPTATATVSPTATATASPTAVATATATETPAPRYKLDIQPVLPTEGKITVSPPADRDGKYAGGTVIVVRAEPIRGCSFGEWTGSMTSTDAALKFEIANDTTLKATFWCLLPLPTPTPTATPGIIIFPTFGVPKIDLTPLILLP